MLYFSLSLKNLFILFRIDKSVIVLGFGVGDRVSVRVATCELQDTSFRQSSLDSVQEHNVIVFCCLMSSATQKISLIVVYWFNALAASFVATRKARRFRASLFSPVPCFSSLSGIPRLCSCS
ncbi:hypothetical protein HN873_010870 [Arachis hypogaea]